ncbi:unnamed protein product [Dovyalis caffra]|uniref:CRM domain-containing protein n=1 Tax=Dovyalis caffra TaxID=77055 RepID=A0AAV1RFF1_9ROSI|nr:unnamed protein product [Dovyalis caffra]
MAIVASLPAAGLNLFSSLPSATPPGKDPTSSSSPPPLSPPIPIPKYPLLLKNQKNPLTLPSKSPIVKPSTTSPSKMVVGSSHQTVTALSFEAIGHPGTGFLALCASHNAATLDWQTPLKANKKKTPVFDSFNPPPVGKKGVKYVEMPGPFSFGKFPEDGKSREEILGEPLKTWEIKMLIKPHLSDNRQVNLGRDGLTHNMLELVHTHWKRRRVCKVRCKGIPTVDMDNVCRHLEEKTGGKIIHRVGGVLYLFRGRNYNYRTRPQYPVMLWKPATPVYPKLIQEAPQGLTKAEADELRKKAKNLLPICKLAKNGVYITLVRDVRTAFEGSPLVKVDCKGMEPSDYKKLGAKLKDLVPCVLLSFDDEQILMWRGQDWKSMYQEAAPSVSFPAEEDIASCSDDSGKSDDDCDYSDAKIVSSSPKMMSLWKHALESNKAVLLNEIDLGPDALLRKVEEFESVSQATEHSYPALVMSSEDDTSNSISAFEDDSLSESFCEDEMYSDDEYCDSESFEDVDTSVPPGSLPIDLIAEELNNK